MEILKFNLTRKEVRVDLETEDGTVTPYFIRELTGKERDTYVKLLNIRVDGGKASVGRVDGLETGLLALCLRDEAGKLVKAEKIGGWRAAVVEEMATIAMKLSALNKDAQEEAGNA